MSDDESTDLSELDFDEHHREVAEHDDIWGSGDDGETDWSDHEQIMPDLIPEHGDEEEDEKDCWICFVRESENPKAQWVTPCKCSGTMGHVHQECIKRWVEEKQGDNFNEEGFF